jgi:hypothetical protein
MHGPASLLICDAPAYDCHGFSLPVLIVSPHPIWVAEDAGVGLGIPGIGLQNDERRSEHMPPRGVRKGSKRARQYEHIKKSEMEAGRSERRAEEIAARAVNKEKARAGESKTASRVSTSGRSASSRGGKRSGNGPGGRTREQLYNDAKRLGIEGRSKMSKDQLQRAVAGAS